MKFLKLGLIFAIFVGAIVVVVNWKSIVQPGDHDTGFSQTDKISVEDKCNTFRSQWSNAKSWDQALYDRQIKQVKAWKEQKLLSELSHKTVSTTVREQAIAKINKSYKDLLSPQTYNHTKLLGVYSGVKYLKTQELNSDQDFREVDGIHSLYLKVKEFIGSPHNITPSFDVENGQWSSFTAAQNRILNTAASYRNNQYFSYIKGIPGFQTGLNAETLRVMLNKEKTRYYVSLSNMIAQAINNLPPNEENYNRMKSVYERFAEESPSNSAKVYNALKNMKNNLPTE